MRSSGRRVREAGLEHTVNSIVTGVSNPRGLSLILIRMRLRQILILETLMGTHVLLLMTRDIPILRDQTLIQISAQVAKVAG